MALPALKESLGLLAKLPVLWIPGLVAGLLGAGLWVLLFTSGTFFASRLIIIFGLVILLFIAGMLGIIKKGEGGFSVLVREGVRYYFRVLLPQIVIVFAVTLVILFLMMVATLVLGGTPDISILSLISLVIIIPALFFTVFYDTAAVFEDLKVLDSIRRSISVVVTNAGNVILFFIICTVYCVALIFALIIVWTISLYDKLQPITTFNETQMAAFTPDQLFALFGQDGMWITAVIIFIGVLILVPLITTYKACFYRKIAGSPMVIQQVTGEYDSKGRWYKY